MNANEQIQQAIQANLESKNPELDLSHLRFNGDEPALDMLEQCQHLVVLKFTREYGLTQLPQKLPQSLLGLSITANKMFPHTFKDLTPLARLTNLVKLVLNCNYDLTNLEGLENLTKLTHLSLDECPELTNLAALQTLKQLEWLSLEDCNKLLDISPLASLTKLATLNLASCHQLANLSPLTQLPSLTTLALNSTQVSDLTPLTPLVNLEYLDVSANYQLTNIAPLRALSHLQTLDVSQTQITDLSPLWALPHLTHLSVNGFDSAKMWPQDSQKYTMPLDPNSLQGLTQLTQLKLSHQQLGNLEPLRSLIHLEELYLDKNQLTDLTPMQGMKNLRKLHLDSNQIHDVTPLKGLIGLQELYLNTNQITDLTPLNPLTNLHTLYIISNQVGDLTPLNTLTNLDTLYASNNHIKTLPSLNNLAKLTNLYLSNNQIANVALSQGLDSLHTLDLSKNRLSQVPALTRLPKLNRLLLDHNRIAQVPPDWVLNFPDPGYLTLHDNPIANVPPELIAEDHIEVPEYGTMPMPNCLKEVRHYFTDLVQGQTKVHQAKLILIGNGRVGKTSLIRRWRDKTFNPTEQSTHAIQLRSWSLPEEETKKMALDEVQLQVWDFGGQDIYHHTHQLFMKTRAVFILVWDAQTEQQATQSETLIDGTKVTYHNHPLSYWLNYAHTLGQGSPVLVVQSKKGYDGKKTPAHWEELQQRYRIVGHVAIEASVDDNDDNGINDFEYLLLKTLRQQVKHQSYHLPASWWKVQQALGELQAKHTKTISRETFSQICEAQGVLADSQVTLLEYLHDTGKLFYHWSLSKKQVILDQRWAIDGVYTLFNRQGLFIRLQNNGYFSGKDLIDRWEEAARNAHQPLMTQDEQALLVSFMEACGICVKINGQSKTLEEQAYFAPQLLPDEPIPHQEALFLNEGNIIYFKFKHPFLHSAIMQKLMLRLPDRYEPQNLRKNRLLLTNFAEVGLILVEAFPVNNEIVVRLKVNNRKINDKPTPEIGIQAVLDQISKEINIGHQSIKGITQWVSIDGIGYIAWDTLLQHPSENPLITADNGKTYNFSDFSLFLETHHISLSAKLPRQKLSPETMINHQIQQALRCLDLADIGGYFEALPKGDIPDEHQHLYNTLWQRYIIENDSAQLRQQLKVFALKLWD
ncbi:MAG TPA: hypothetical protein DCS93_01900 [Microscillaceae bacterium]|nr:hypothetical protein [Microscillaceae bacterium]